MAKAKSARPKCDSCGKTFTRAHQGTLAWWCSDDRVVKVRLLHEPGTRPEGCWAQYREGRGPGVMLYDTPSFAGTLPIWRVKDILSHYRFSDEDAQWLRATFGIPPPTLEERVVKLEKQVAELLGRLPE